MREITPENTLGERIREERLLRSMSQTELAEKLRPFGFNFNASTINKMENRDVETPRLIRLNEADAVAKVFGVPLMTLYEDRGSTARAHERDIRAKRLEWVRASEALQDSIVEAVEHLAELYDSIPTNRAPEKSPDVKRFQQILGVSIAEASRYARTLVATLEGLEYYGRPETSDDGIVRGDHGQTAP